MAECLAETEYQPETTLSKTIPLAEDTAYQYLLAHKMPLVVDNARVPGERKLVPVQKRLASAPV